MNMSKNEKPVKEHSDDFLSDVYAANVQLNFPEEWGDPRVIVDLVQCDRLHDEVYANFMKWVKQRNSESVALDIGYIEDITNGFDTSDIRVCVQFDGDIDLLRRTVEAMRKALHPSYMQISYRKRRKAKFSKKSRKVI